MCWCTPPNPATLRLMPCFFCGFSPNLASCLTFPASVKVTSTPCTLAHLNAVLRDTLRGGRTLLRRGQGGSGARTAAPERLGALRWSYGHCGHVSRWCEVARGRCNGRLCMYSDGPQTLVPLSPTHGFSVCTWRHSKKLIVTSAFIICRPGDAVVSGPRKTRHKSVH